MSRDRAIARSRGKDSSLERFGSGNFNGRRPAQASSFTTSAVISDVLEHLKNSSEDWRLKMFVGQIKREGAFILRARVMRTV